MTPGRPRAVALVLFLSNDPFADSGENAFLGRRCAGLPERQRARSTTTNSRSIRRPPLTACPPSQSCPSGPFPHTDERACGVVNLSNRIAARHSSTGRDPATMRPSGPRQRIGEARHTRSVNPSPSPLRRHRHSKPVVAKPFATRSGGRAQDAARSQRRRGPKTGRVREPVQAARTILPCSRGWPSGPTYR